MDVLVERLEHLRVGSTATTSAPSSRTARVSLPVPAPTSATRMLLSPPATGWSIQSTAWIG